MLRRLVSGFSFASLHNFLFLAVLDQLLIAESLLTSFVDNSIGQSYFNQLSRNGFLRSTMPLNSVSPPMCHPTQLTSPVEILLDKAQRTFESTYSSSDGCKFFASFAPGRVNLIGEHTDYNDGFVMPVAIEHGTVIYGSGKLVDAPSPNANRVRVVSDSISGGPATFTADRSLAPGAERWANYVKGVFYEYVNDLPPAKGFVIDIAISGSLPKGSGLSSSASLTVSVATFIEAFYEYHGIKLSEDPREKARRCRLAEHKFLNTPCGIMDQFVSALAPPNHAILLDCQSETFEGYPLNDSSVSIVVTDCKIKHSLAERGNQYPVRVAQCKAAADAMGVPSLRHATMEMLRALQSSSVDKVIASRARHVITENDRCLKFARALKEVDYSLAGVAMFESHYSLRDDYEVSIPELDFLVELARSVDGVYGSRLTGAGFGGCTVTLAKTEVVPELISHLKREYKKKYGIECSVFVTSAGIGAHVLIKPQI